MSQKEFKYYEYQIISGQLDQYRNPSMKEQLWKDLMNDIISQVVEVHIPQNIRDWKRKGASKVPSRNKIRLLAHRLQTLVNNPELEEVSKQKLQWFKNIGNSFIELEHIQTKMVRAVMGGNEKVYKDLHYQYTMTALKIKKMMDDHKKWQLPRKELEQVRRKNLTERRKKVDEKKLRYEYTRKLLREGKLNWTVDPKDNKKILPKKEQKSAPKANKDNKKQVNTRRGARR